MGMSEWQHEISHQRRLLSGYCSGSQKLEVTRSQIQSNVNGQISAIIKPHDEVSVCMLCCGRRTHGVLWAGLGFLVLHWGIFLHFTYALSPLLCILHWPDHEEPEVQPLAPSPD